ncbi:hypothetical protein JCM10212_002398 [Sporobolomyces blumeae]
MTSYQQRPTVILTGASRGIGLATLELLLNEDVNVVALSRSTPPELDHLANKYTGSLIISKGDVANDQDNKAAVDVAIQSFGRLDALVLNAGTLHPLGTHRTLHTHLDEYKSLFDVNFFSLVSIVGHALPYLTSRESKRDLAPGSVAGRVILVSSGAAVGGVAGWGAYNASKAAMNSLCRTLANEEKDDLVVVAVRPGVVATEMQEKIREIGGQHMTEKDHEKFTGLHSRGELLLPSQPGLALASLALHAPRDLSGEFVNWNDDKVEKVLVKQNGPKE